MTGCLAGMGGDKRAAVDASRGRFQTCPYVMSNALRMTISGYT